MWWWRIRGWLYHPVYNFYWYLKAHHAPQPGDLIVDCRGLTLRVTAADDDVLILEDGTRASWMHCCDWPEKP
jgi:hypothetical protein